ncbi:MAG: hypothetical protein RLZZ305_1825 [Actinomycetota bacterium]|jgi:hypothetical protein
MVAAKDAASTVERWRSEIGRAVALGAGGPLPGVLGAEGCGHCYVVKVLDVHPCLGKVKGRRLMHAMGIGPGVRLGELSVAQRELLAAECRCGRDG